MKMEINLTKIIIILTILFSALSILYASIAGLLLIFAIFLYGFIGKYAGTKNEKLALFLGLLFISISIILINGIKFGIDFVGGTRIPVFLSNQVDQETMYELINKIKARASTLAIEQVIVKAIGNDRLLIELPSNNEEQIKKVENILKAQGLFIAVVDGIVVLEGKDIIPGTIAPVPSSSLAGADWGVSFTITRKAAEEFSKKVKGKANRPLMLFLDKPYNATVIIEEKWLASQALKFQTQGINITPAEIFLIMEKALKDEKGSIKILIISENENASINKSDHYITSEKIAKMLKLDNATIVNESDLYPEFILTQNGLFITSWKAVGLMSAPFLNPSVTSGSSISLTYQITGNVRPNLTLQEKLAEAKNQERFIISVLKGGALPVKLYIGNKEKIPPYLGERFLNYSIYALLFSVLLISLFVVLRYKDKKFFFPVILITISELLILVAVIGSFSIDLAAMAGLIVSMGVSVDAQIIIADELKKNKNPKEAFKNAFTIIRTNVIIAVLALLPFFLTYIVEVIGFVVVTLISYILGLFISRPAYAALIE
jgi:preprotein translocase subunit SecD